METLLKGIAASALTWGLFTISGLKLSKLSTLSKLLLSVSLPLAYAAAHYFIMPPQWPLIDAMSYVFAGMPAVAIAVILIGLLSQNNFLQVQWRQTTLRIIVLLGIILFFVYWPLKSSAGFFDSILPWSLAFIIALIFSRRYQSNAYRLLNLHLGIFMFIMSALFITFFSSSLALLTAILGGLFLANFAGGIIFRKQTLFQDGGFIIATHLSAAFILLMSGTKLTGVSGESLFYVFIALGFIVILNFTQTKKNVINAIAMTATLLPILIMTLLRLQEYLK